MRLAAVAADRVARCSNIFLHSRFGLAADSVQRGERGGSGGGMRPLFVVSGQVTGQHRRLFRIHRGMPHRRCSSMQDGENAAERPKGARNVYCGCDCVSACEWCVVLVPVLACKWSLFHKTIQSQPRRHAAQETICHIDTFATSLCIHCEAHLKPLYAQYLHNGKLSSSSSRLHALKQLTVLLFSDRCLAHCPIYILAGDEKSAEQQPSLDQIRPKLAISPHSRPARPFSITSLRHE